MKFGFQNTLKLTAAAATLCVLAPAAFGQGIGESTLRDLMTPTPKKLARGATLYGENCASCHGSTGLGDGPNAAVFGEAMPNLTEGELGGPIQMHNAIALGTNGHPLFEHLPYQDLWAVTHYARSLNPANVTADPPEVVEKAMFEAREGVCNPAVKSGIDQKMKFAGDAQITQGMAVYAANCSSCHGAEGKGDGSAAASLNPAPRNFHEGSGWTNGTSALSIFNTLAVGIEGTSMAAFTHLPESDRWALTHLIREKWLPAGAKAEPTPEELDAVCRSLSGGASLATLEIEDAMKFVVGEVEEARLIRMKQYGPAWVDASANANAGQEVYEKHCLSCHGPRGVGTTLGPYGSQPPYLAVKVNQLEPGLAGGTYKDFAKRSIGGAHTAIPDVTGASHIKEDDWRALQAYVTSFEGYGDVKPASEMPQPDAPEGAEGTEETEQPAPASPEEAAPAETSQEQ